VESEEMPSPEQERPAIVQEEVPEAAPLIEPRPSQKSQIDLLKVVTLAFENTVKDDGRSYLPQMSKEVKRLDPTVDFKSHGKAGLREYLEEFSDVFTLHKEGRNIYVSKRKGKRPSQHISELVR